MTRRLAMGGIGIALGLFVVGVLVRRAGDKDVRCQNCGMKIDRASPWASEIVFADGSTASFDTPRCAFTVFRNGKVGGATLRVQEYYERRWRPATELRFIVGGDVAGPMGPDLVPVDPARASKFIQDHGADRALTLDEVTAAIVTGLK